MEFSFRPRNWSDPVHGIPNLGWNREYKEGYAPQWGLDYSLFAFSGGIGVNFGTREMRKAAREARAKQGER